MDHKKGLENAMENSKRIREVIPTEFSAFFEFTGKVYKDGVLDVKTKELITLGIAIAVRCEGCIESHIKKFIAAGGTKEELGEVIAVSIAMGGGPSTVYGGKALEAFEQFTAK